MAKKFLAALFIIFSLLVANTKDSFAQTPEPWTPSTSVTEFENYRSAIQSDNCMSPSLECLVHQVYTFVSLEFINSTLYSDIEPNININDQNVIQINSSSNTSKKNSLLSGVGNLIGNFYAYPAANTRTFIVDVMNSAHITPKVYAQGLGFASLNPVLELWKAFRNIAYMFFVIIFIVIGFMIMFRQKISGQAAVTAQQAIPGVIISLILVTFSYAIAGLLIDFMYLTMYLILGIFGNALPGKNLIDWNIMNIGASLFIGAADIGTNKDLVSGLLENLVISDGLITKGAEIIGGLALSVVIALAILFGTISLFFELLKSYATIIFSVVTAPLVLMMGALPGKNTAVTWIRNLVGNLLPFPVVLLVLVMFFQFTQNSGLNIKGGFMPPFLLAQGSPEAIVDLLGLALILALPQIVKEAKKPLVSEGLGSTIFKAATDSAAKGWKGGEIIPGVAATNTSRLPVLGSGKDFAATVGTGLWGAAGGAAKASTFIRRPRRLYKDIPALFGSGFIDSANTAGEKTGSRLAKFIKDRNSKKGGKP